MLERDSAALGAGAGGGRAARRRAAAARRSATRCGAAARASCTRTTCIRRSAGGRWPPRARRARGSCCTCTTTGSCARSGPASRAARTARAATAATRCRACALNCRGSRAEALVYGAALALWQRRLAGRVDAFVVPSAFALGRLRELGAPLGGRARVIPSVQRVVRGRRRPRRPGASRSPPGRLTPEKGFADAIEACAAAGVPLVIAGDGPQLRGAARARRRRALHRPRRARPSWRALRREAARRDRARRATRRSCRWPRWRRWRRGCRSSPRAPAGWPRSVPGEGLYPPGDVAALAERVRRCGRRGRRRAGAGAARAVSPPWRRAARAYTGELRRVGGPRSGFRTRAQRRSLRPTPAALPSRS